MKSVPEVTYIRITLRDESIKFMAFVTRDRGNFFRDPSRTNINMEIAKGPFAESIKHWHYIDQVDIPKDRTYRDALLGRQDGSYGVDDGLAKDIDAQRAKLAAVQAVAEAAIEQAAVRVVPALLPKK